MTKQLRDDMVLAVQQWLNKTYGGVSGYEKAPENGNTGWSTIYSLREGLQHELGISPVASGFGPATEAKLKPIVGKIQIGYKGNIAKLIQGAFWCKGISPEGFDTEFTAKTKAAVISMQKNAGLSGDGIVTVPFMKALFDMMAFSLVSGGDKNIRNMQQTLNHDYNAYFGILPCDGIYQRDTNTALIYALQAEEGMDTSTANGVYGPGTIEKTPTMKPGDHGNVVRLIQWGLYANGYNKNAEFSGTFDSYIANEVIAFRKFMNLPPFNSTGDLTVIKGLLTSNGNTNRDSIACDTSTPLTAANVATLKQYGFSIVGRYLTGTVGVKPNDRPKNLTISEIETITEGGLSIFPIYQDYDGDPDYFTATQGRLDALTARNTALSLGFPKGTTIYFAVDSDVLDGDIASVVLPYIKAVNAEMTYYNVGIYGTRNVCSHALAAGAAKTCFVSNMSTGFSGNLGYKMPEKWGFDQFVEYSIGSLPIDQVAASGLDKGSDTFNIDPGQIMADTTHNLVSKIPGCAALWNVDFSLTSKFEHHDLLVDVYGEVKDKWDENNKKKMATLSVKNGKISGSLDNTFTKYGNLLVNIKKSDLEAIFNDVAPTLKDGSISATPKIRNGLVGVKFVFEASKDLGKKGKVSFTVTIEVYVHEGGFGIPAKVLADAFASVPEYEAHLNPDILPELGTLALVACMVGVAFALPEAIPAFVAILPKVGQQLQFG